MDDQIHSLCLVVRKDTDSSSLFIDLTHLYATHIPFYPCVHVIRLRRPPSHMVSLSGMATPGVGLGYGIAIAVSILVLSTIMLASYACIRVKSSSLTSSYVDTRDAVNPASDPQVVVVLGLDEKSIESYPKTVLGESRRLPEPNNGSSSCSICLGEYRAKEVVRSVPGYHHCFHAECVDAWLRVSATCPLCRSSPASTPLSELVQLAFHPR